MTVAVVQRNADVQIKLTTTSKPTVGKVLKAASVVLNHGADDAPGASLDFRVPAGSKLVALGSAQGSCSVACAIAPSRHSRRRGARA